MSRPVTRHQPPPGSAPSQPSQELLYSADVPSLSHAERARTLCAQAPSATLCTLSSSGHPYGSLVLFALLENGDAALLISEMAEHTRNLRRDTRCSLLVAESATGNPLARGRVTLVGEAAVEEDGTNEARAAFLRRNPGAAQYADYGDFATWRVRVERVRYIGGFGRMSFLGMSAWHDARADAVAVGCGAGELIKKLNSYDFAPVAMKYSLAERVDSACVRSIDMYGIEVDAVTEHGPRPIRVAFSTTATSVENCEQLAEELLQSVS